MTSPDDTRIYDWRVEQGEREQLTVPVLLDDDPFDVSEWTIDVKIKTRPGGPVLHTFPAEDIEVLEGGTSVLLTVPAATSAAWTWTSGWWRCKVTNPSDATNVQRIVQGAFLVDPD